MSGPRSDKSITRDRIVIFVELFTSFVFQPLCLCLLATKDRYDKNIEWEKKLSQIVYKKLQVSTVSLTFVSCIVFHTYC